MIKSTNGFVKPTNNTYKSPEKRYDENFVASEEYLKSLPDMQNMENAGARVAIQHVGIHNFKIPMNIRLRDGKSREVHCAVTGSVSLEAAQKGINMSRIMRTFYQYEQQELTPETLKDVVRSYLKNLDSSSARIAIAFDFPMQKESLRSGLSGYQYYPVVLETDFSADNGMQQFMHLDFTYSSACPCSYELAEHAKEVRHVAAVPHSQRSVAKISIKYNEEMPIEDLVDLCRDALKTETQVMVKREDEQAFAELNAAYLKFVEDAVRALFEKLNADSRIQDFRVFASHQESLHSHDAISVITKGVAGGFTAQIAPFIYNER
ncbi:MAG: GTP cyclohydrolase I FolE2 [Deferribacteres bacterium]|nr:GTP cyclohydrolase I FolE2 [candidate division KSB1 bacterium]MCB9502447.1 GTP cyclohydrolase I FolE2 [Deferribacteres bacterium]